MVKASAVYEVLEEWPAFQWKSPRERPDFAYFEEAFRDYPHSNENCSIADWLGGSSTKSAPLSSSSSSSFLFIVRLFSTLARHPVTSPVFLTQPMRGNWEDREKHTVYRVFCPVPLVPLGPPALYYSPFSCPWTLLRAERAFCLARHSSSRSNARGPLWITPASLCSFFSFRSSSSSSSFGYSNDLDIGRHYTLLWIQ